MVVRIKREISYLKFLKHPHIIRLYEVITTPTDIIMVMEYSSVELFDYIVSKGKLDHDHARKLFQQIISAVEYCHRHKIVHRDLKPENVLLDDKKNVKIADFGLCNIMKDGDFLQTSCGSPNYASPEVISGKLYAGPEVDVWSCGVILYVMLTGKLPFDDEAIPQLFKKINGGVFKIPTYLSVEARDLIMSMLTVDPTQRITIAEMRNNPWFLKDLPEYLLPLPQVLDTNVIQVDDSIVEKLAKRMGLEREEVFTSLKDPKDSKIRVAYQLLVDNRHLSEKVANEKNKGACLTISSTISPPKSDFSESRFSPTIQPLSSSISKTGFLPSKNLKRPKVRPKWYYGLRSKNNPNEIILELYNALKSIGMEWKTVNDYHIRARYKTRSDTIVKFDIVLYKISTDKYLVDFKNSPVDPKSQLLDVFGFFEACSALISALAF